MKKMLLDGIKEKDVEKYNKDPKIYTSIDNQYKKTGFGYRVIYNKQSDSYLKWDFDTSKLDGVYLLPPYTDKQTFNLIVPGNEERIIVGMRNKNFGTYWFNLLGKCSISNAKVPVSTASDSITEIHLKSYMTNNIEKEITDLSVYDYQSSPFESNQNFIIVHPNKKQQNFISPLENLTKQNPYLLNLVSQLPKIEGQEGLNWKKLEFDNGNFFGEVDSNSFRKGRGAYLWNEGTFYVGYWENNSKNGSGKIFTKEKKLFYEGSYFNGMRHGSGTQIYKDGSKYIGEFYEDKRHGKGKIFWNDGSSWEGTFNHGDLNGDGVFQENNDEPFNVKYENGKVKYE